MHNKKKAFVTKAPNNQLNEDNPSRRNFKRLWFPLFIVLHLIIGHNVSAQQDKDKKKNVIKPGKRQAVLILSDGSTIQLSANDSLNYTEPMKSVTRQDSTCPKCGEFIAPKANNTTKPNGKSKKQVSKT